MNKGRLEAFSYYLLTVALLKSHDEQSLIFKAIGNKTKERISLFLYITGVVLSFWYPKVSFAIFVVVALIWLIPDRRIEKQLNN